MKIRNRIAALQTREKIIKYQKLEPENSNSNLVKTNRKVVYEYYKCDYCNDEIRLDKKEQERSGGITVLPHTLTKSGKLQLVLCNKCLNKVIREFSEEINK